VMYDRMGPKVKMFISVIQIVTALPFVLKLHFPPIFDGLLTKMSVINLNIFSDLGITCSQDLNYIDYLYFVTIGPLIICFLLFLIFLFEFALTRMNPKKVGVLKRTRSMTEDANLLYGKYLLIFLIGSFLVLPGISIYIFRTFTCINLDPDSEVKGDDVYLMADYSISCTSEAYYRARSYAVIMVFVYPIGVPLVYYLLLWSHKSLILRRKEIELSEYEKKLILPFSSLYGAYEPQFYYWEVIETFRRIALTGALVLVNPGSGLQIVVALLVSFLFIKLYSYYGIRRYISPLIFSSSI
jgi:hypothetical protein